ncbi:PH domain-containing protein [Bacillus massiliigorillae]|uniref:PH domain-containing protein n=1 Tax=Bacillus massiliigorillae TaxID=1243664 RepID=UPI00039A6F38|nr:PH domain-containing protein [Bacillus massiliigorillae]
MELQNRISLRALKVWRQTGLIVSACMLIIAIAVTIIRYIFDGPLWLVYGSWGMFVILFLLLVFLIPSLRWKWWRYEVRDEEIEIQKGLFIITRTLVPMVRVQHVDTQQGPLMRKNNLASVEISTAATVHEIPALDYDEAERLRAFIVEMIRTVKDDV